MNEISIIDFKLNIEECVFSLVLNFWVFILAIILFFLFSYLIKKFIKKGKIHKEIIPVTFKYSLGGQEIEYEIVRNYQNIEIAHRIYVELITRKTSLPIDEKHDVIVEVYNSWYTLFQTTREELKTLSGELLLNNDVSRDLIRLLTDILNKGLRPHLTEYQAKFRKWYNESLSKKENENLSPQQIQAQYEKYDDLINSMKSVNQLLIEYADKLKEIAIEKGNKQ
jgi:hemerythrin